MAIGEPILGRADFFRTFTVASYSDEIGNTIREASEHDVVNAVFRNVYSPRGTVAGTSELAAAVAALNELKPIYACSSDLNCIASIAHAIHVAPFAKSSLSYYFPDKLIGDERNFLVKGMVVGNDRHGGRGALLCYSPITNHKYLFTFHPPRSPLRFPRSAFCFGPSIPTHSGLRQSARGGLG